MECWPNLKLTAYKALKLLLALMILHGWMLPRHTWLPTCSVHVHLRTRLVTMCVRIQA